VDFFSSNARNFKYFLLFLTPQTGETGWVSGDLIRGNKMCITFPPFCFTFGICLWRNNHKDISIFDHPSHRRKSFGLQRDMLHHFSSIIFNYTLKTIYFCVYVYINLFKFTIYHLFLIHLRYLFIVFEC